MKKQFSAAERVQRNQLPAIAPLIDNWEISAWVDQSRELGGAFYDWFCLPDGFLALTLGDAQGQGLEGALAACAVKTAVRAHGTHHRQADKTLQKANLTLWTSSAGDQFAELFYGIVKTSTGQICYASAGNPSVILFRGDQWKSLSKTTVMLGESPETDYRQFTCQLQPGDTLLVCNQGMRNCADQQGLLMDESNLAELLSVNLNLSADQLAAMARECLQLHAANPLQHDATLLVLKRT
ncbi:MAG: PP2C family protein-serine/threonine phosphatase, partial [Thermoguttaceae bacterium]